MASCTFLVMRGGRSEPNVQGRVNTNISRIIQFLQGHPRIFLSVQEWNPQDLATLTTQLGAQFGILSAGTFGESFNHALIYNTALFTLLNQSTKDLNRLNSIAWNASGKNGNQTNRYLHATFKENATNQTVDVVALHLKWGSQAGNINAAIQSLVNQYNNLILMGDCNADLRNGQPLSNATCLVSVCGSQSSLNGQASLNTTDAIVYKLSTLRQILDPAAPAMSSPQSVPSMAVSLPSWGRYSSYDDLLSRGITGSIQLDVDNAFRRGLISREDLIALAYKNTATLEYRDFNEQPNTWRQIIAALQTRVSSTSVMQQPQPSSSMSAPLPYMVAPTSYTGYSIPPVMYPVPPMQSVSYPNPHTLAVSRPLWGCYYTYEELLSKGLTGSIQAEVDRAFRQGIISREDVIFIAYKDASDFSYREFKEQSIVWSQIKRNKGLPLS